MLRWTLLALLASSVAAQRSKCTNSGLSPPALPDARIRSFTAAAVHNYSIATPQNGAGPSFNTTWTNLNFCNVSVVYSHAGHDMPITVQVWLPLQGWNGRFQGTGGGGFAAGLGPDGLAPAVGMGYSAAETNAGHSENQNYANDWAFNRTGQVNEYGLEVFASTSLNDLAVIGKTVTKEFYGQDAKYAYWNGCSTGGRQGLMLAQRYPEAYDGILALSPVINWPKVTVSTYWQQHIMNRLHYFPQPCELQFIRSMAVQACDGQDGVEDGVVSLPEMCFFDATSIVGMPFLCNGVQQVVSSEAAIIANSAWSGPRSPNGDFLWYGFNRDAIPGTGQTACSGLNGSSCYGEPFPLGVQWMQNFVQKDRSFAVQNISNAEYASIFHASVREYQHVIATADPNLSAFKAQGGKMISTHGLADPIIPFNGTVQYYNQVLAYDTDAADFYRFFKAPGVGHCGNEPYGIGHYPNDTLEALVRWVEHGEAPITLMAVNHTAHGTSVRNLCPYPKVQRYVGGDPRRAENFVCL